MCFANCVAEIKATSILTSHPSPSSHPLTNTHILLYIQHSFCNNTQFSGCDLGEPLLSQWERKRIKGDAVGR